MYAAEGCPPEEACLLLNMASASLHAAYEATVEILQGRVLMNQSESI
jgi:hypothetical protein